MTKQEKLNEMFTAGVSAQEIADEAIPYTSVISSRLTDQARELFVDLIQHVRSKIDGDMQMVRELLETLPVETIRDLIQSDRQRVSQVGLVRSLLILYLSDLVH